MVDNTGYIPKYTKMSADLLAPNVGFALFVSSISAYASFTQPNDESSPAAKLTDPSVEQVTNETYGPMKAACEQATLEAFSAHSSRLYRRAQGHQRSLPLLADALFERR